MSKQSNEVMAAAKDNGRERTPRRGEGPRPNRDEFVAAKAHADDVLGLDEKVSDGLRRSMLRFKNSPLTLMMEILNDEEQPWERRLDAAERAKPYLHRKLEDKHGTQAQGGGNGNGGNGAGSSPAATGPTINLTVNRPRVQVNTREREVDQPAAAKQSTAAKHAQSPAEAAPQKQQGERPKAFKKPARTR